MIQAGKGTSTNTHSDPKFTLTLPEGTPWQIKMLLPFI